MTPKQFGTQILIVSLVSVGILMGLFQVPKLAPYHWLGWVSLGFFILLSLLMYLFGRQSALSKNKNDFTNTVLGFTAGKMFLAVMVIFAYLKLAEPQDKLFIIPFFAVYFIFTAFETYVMMKLGRTGV